MSDDIVEFNLGNNGGSYRLVGWDEVITWFSEERARWVWLDSVQPSTGAGDLPGVMRQAFSKLQADINNTRQRADVTISVMSNIFQGAYAPTGWLIHSKSQLGMQILDIREKLGELAAAFAAGFAKKRVKFTDAVTVEQLSALWLLAVPEYVEPIALAQALASERSAIQQQVQVIENEARRQADEQNAVWVDTLAKARRVAARALRRRTDLWTRQQDAREARANESVEAFKQIEKAYVDQMGLQAPVEYWKGEAAKHKAATRTLFKSLIWFFVASIVILGVAFFYIGTGARPFAMDGQPLVTLEHGKIVSIYIKTPGLQFQDETYQVLRAKFGRPFGDVRTPKVTTFGVRVNQISTNWTFPFGHVAYLGFADNDVTEGAIMISTYAYDDEQKAKVRPSAF